MNVLATVSRVTIVSRTNKLPNELVKSKSKLFFIIIDNLSTIIPMILKIKWYSKVAVKIIVISSKIPDTMMDTFKICLWSLIPSNFFSVKNANDTKKLKMKFLYSNTTSEVYLLLMTWCIAFWNFSYGHTYINLHAIVCMYF